MLYQGDLSEHTRTISNQHSFSTLRASHAEQGRDSLLPDGSTTHRVVDDALRLLRMTVAAASGKAIPLGEAGQGN